MKCVQLNFLPHEDCSTFVTPNLNITMDYKYIVVEGNIGAGKTTLATKLAQHFEGQLILETFTDNPYLTPFYENPEQFALPLELYFFMDRLNQLKNVNFGKTPVVADYSFEKSQIFAGVTLKDEELKLFQTISEHIKTSLPAPDLYIYLHAPISKLKQNILRRGRSYEQDITMEYLEKIQNAYQPFLRKYKKTLLIEMEDVDFENEAHFLQLIDFLKKGYDFSNHIFRLD